MQSKIYLKYAINYIINSTSGIVTNKVVAERSVFPETSEHSMFSAGCWSILHQLSFASMDLRPIYVIPLTGLVVSTLFGIPLSTSAWPCSVALLYSIKDIIPKSIKYSMALDSEIKIYDQQLKINAYSNKLDNKSFLANSAIRKLYSFGIEAFRASAYDCRGLAGNLFANLLSDPEFNGTIEAFENSKNLKNNWAYNKLDHTYLVIDRDMNSNPHDMNTWNDNAIIACPWYECLISVGEIKEKNGGSCKPFTNKYPFLDPSIKSPSFRIENENRGQVLAEINRM